MPKYAWYIRPKLVKKHAILLAKFYFLGKSKILEYVHKNISQYICNAYLCQQTQKIILDFVVPDDFIFLNDDNLAQIFQYQSNPFRFMHMTQNAFVGFANGHRQDVLLWNGAVATKGVLEWYKFLNHYILSPLGYRTFYAPNLQIKTICDLKFNESIDEESYFECENQDYENQDYENQDYENQDYENQENPENEIFQSYESDDTEESSEWSDDLCINLSKLVVV